ncbi:MAG TPA: PadR family transcriptional regulator, partial [Clostridiales bacterium]|nr:PadR family transcriptional regulator [Clostridiales bacterium]
MDAQMKKGLLDACVLHILTKGDTYGYKLTREITDLMDVSESSLYPVLRRLETQGFLETYSAEHSGRLRRYYRIT